MKAKKFPAQLSFVLRVAALVALATIAVQAASKDHVLHAFGLGNDGLNPSSGLIADGVGNFYGTTSCGGAHRLGTVFKLTPSPPNGWKETILYSFKGGTDGLGPGGGLIWDSQGNLYGTTARGGKIGQGCQGNAGCGVVYELTPQVGGKWQEKVLYRFKECGKDGCRPTAGLVFDSLGDLFGTTFYGGSFVCGKMGCGTVFELAQTSGLWQETIVYPFKEGHVDEQTRYPAKVLTPREAHDLSQAGFSLVAVWEFLAIPGYFTGTQGQGDGEYAYRYARRSSHWLVGSRAIPLRIK